MGHQPSEHSSSNQNTVVWFRVGVAYQSYRTLVRLRVPISPCTESVPLLGKPPRASSNDQGYKGSGNEVSDVLTASVELLKIHPKDACRQVDRNVEKGEYRD